MDRLEKAISDKGILTKGIKQAIDNFHNDNPSVFIRKIEIDFTSFFSEEKETSIKTMCSVEIELKIE